MISRYGIQIFNATMMVLEGPLFTWIAHFDLTALMIYTLLMLYATCVLIKLNESCC